MNIPNLNRSTKKNQAYKAFMENSPALGVYIGEITSTLDLTRSGRVQVFIAALSKDPTENDGIFDCFWSSPFAGSTNPAAIGRDIENYQQTQKSYGMWMVTPDVGNLVLVAFGDGNFKFPFVIGCLYPDRLNHMVPGMPAGRSYSDPALLMPVAEKNRRDEKTTHNDAVRPLHVDIAEGIVRQGLITDPLRGAGRSGARRESPSEVFGILTPGPRDPNNFDHRLGGHQFVMDDNVDSRLIRLRTAGGAQLLLDDTTGVVYVINKKGTAWVELGTNGDVMVFSENSISLRAKGNFNLRADKNINIEAGQNINLRAAGDNTQPDTSGLVGFEQAGLSPSLGVGNIRMQAASDVQTRAENNVKLTAQLGDVQVNAGNGVWVTGSGSKGVQLKASSGPMRLSSQGTASWLSQANMLLTAQGTLVEKGSRILLNSGGTSANAAATADVVDELPSQPRLDAAQIPPTFNKQAGTQGQPSSTSAGRRTGAVNSINTIVTVMPTAEPYSGHAQYDPIAASAVQGQVQSGAEPILPFSNSSQTAPADVNTPGAFLRGITYTDANGNPVSTQNLTADQVSQLKPVYQGNNNVFNDFGLMGSTNLLGLSSLSGLVSGVKSAVPSLSFATLNAVGQTVIGLQQILTTQQQQNQQFAINQLAEQTDLNERRIADIRQSVSAALDEADSPSALASILNTQGISVIPDAPGIIYQDRFGNKLIDFSLGLGPVGATLGAVSSMTKVFNDIKGAIFVPLSNNQKVAIVSFAQSIGVEAFLNSNVLSAVNRSEYNDVPRLMMGWVLAPSVPGETAVVQPYLVDRRRYEASVFQTPDELDINVTSTGVLPGDMSYGQLADAIDAKRAQFYAGLENSVLS